MRYYKIVMDNYIYSYGIGDIGQEITKEEYEKIKTAIENYEQPRIGYYKKLKDIEYIWEEKRIPRDLS